MKKSLLYILIAYFSLSAFLYSDDAAEEPALVKTALKVTWDSKRIYVDGKLFFIKGICYAPFYPNFGYTKHAYKKFPKELKEKDFQLMKDAGFNTIRVYENMPDDFYELCIKYDMKVIEPVIFPGHYTNIDNEDVLKDLKKEAVRRVTKMKDHHSILMWYLWNDAPFPKKNLVEKFGFERVNTFFKEIYDAIKEIDENHPVTGANIINIKPGWNVGFEFLDVIGCNSYIGLDHNDMAWVDIRFSKREAIKRVKLMKAFSKKFKKPVFIMETGCSSYTKKRTQHKVIETQIKIVGEKLAGYCIFELTDEWWKAGKDETQEFELEEHWGLCDAYRKPKKVYHIIKKYMNGIPTESKGLNSKLYKKIRAKK